MHLAPAPPSASWTHREARAGFEIVFFRTASAGTLLTGRTTADEAGTLWSVGYTIEVDEAWATRTVRATGLIDGTDRTTELRRGPDGRWTVDGRHRPELDGCVDVDFESSAVTNTLPVHRIDFEPGTAVEVPAAFVRADLTVHRLEQSYTLIDTTDGPRFDYASSTFDFACELRYDTAGLVLGYPGIAVRYS